MRQRASHISTINTTFTAATGLLLYGLYAIEILGERAAYTGLTLLLLTYLGIEVAKVRRVHPLRWAINPVVLGSFMTFVLGYGVTNALFFMPAERLDLVGIFPEVTPAMVKLMGLVLVAALAMWAGYWSPLAAKLTSPSVVARIQTRFLLNSRLRPLTIPVLLLISAVSRLLQVKLGVFGYSSTYEQLMELGSVTQYLAMGASLGKLALVLAACRYFAANRKKSVAKWFFFAVGLEVLWGVLGGFKSAVVMPIIIAAICQYLMTSKMGKQWFMFFVAGLVIAYALIEPFRAARNQDVGFRSNSLFAIASTMWEALAKPPEAAGDSPSLILAVASRSNLTYIGSFGVQYADDGMHGAPGDPDFLGNLLLAPAHAWIPRFLWDSKPLGTLGLWYNQTVLGLSHFSSTAMGPVTYLYFAGGILAVIVAFWLVGVIQRILFFSLQPWNSLSGTVVFFGTLQTITIIDSAFNGVLVSLLRDLPLMIILCSLIFARARHGSFRSIPPKSVLR
jgi:hypothetical protein